MKYPQTTVECAVELSSLWSRHERLHNGDGMLKNVLIEAEDRMQRLDNLLILPSGALWSRMGKRADAASDSLRADRRCVA